MPSITTFLRHETICKTIYATYEEKDNRNHDWKRWISVFFWSRYVIIFYKCSLCRFVGWIWVQSDAWDSKRIQKYVSRNPKTNPTIQTNKISHGPPFSNDFWIFSVKFLKKKEFILATYLTEHRIHFFPKTKLFQRIFWCLLLKWSDGSLQNLGPF